MSDTDAFIVIAIILAFVVFAVVLAWADFQTRHIGAKMTDGGGASKASNENVRKSDALAKTSAATNSAS